MFRSKKTHQMILTFLRVSVGFIFLWSFLDKTFGLGFSTEMGKSWLDGVSPTLGYLSFGTKGPLATTFSSLAGNVIVDWLFMMGLLGIGLSLILGIGMRIGIWSGVTFLFLIYLSAMPPQHNPIIDEHIIYILVLLYFLNIKADEWYGLSAWWNETAFVKKYPIFG